MSKQDVREIVMVLWFIAFSIAVAAENEYLSIAAFLSLLIASYKWLKS